MTDKPASDVRKTAAEWLEQVAKMESVKAVQVAWVEFQAAKARWQAAVSAVVAECEAKRGIKNRRPVMPQVDIGTQSPQESLSDLANKIIFRIQRLQERAEDKVRGGVPKIHEIALVEGRHLPMNSLAQARIALSESLAALDHLEKFLEEEILSQL